MQKPLVLQPVFGSCPAGVVQSSPADSCHAQGGTYAMNMVKGMQEKDAAGHKKIAAYLLPGFEAPKSVQAACSRP